MAVTGYSGLFNHIGGEMYAPLGRNDPINGGTRTGVSRLMRTREGKKLGALIKGAVEGTDAESLHIQRKAVEADQYQNYGGIVKFETIADIDRTVTADDKQLIADIVDETTAADPHPYDKSGNNNGSILQRFGVI